MAAMVQESHKPITALANVAARRQPCLVIVHSKELLNQWVERIEKFLDIPQEEIGVIGSGKRRISPNTQDRVPLHGNVNYYFPHTAYIDIYPLHLSKKSRVI